MIAPSDSLTSQVLATLRQGDLVRFGAVALVGRGAAPPDLTQTFDQAPPAPDSDLWSITIRSDIGWYVICSQDCDIVRNVNQEPCLLICPLKLVPEESWNELRRAPWSPREFPYPGDAKLTLPAGQKPVADFRYITSMLKVALSSSRPEDTLRPLTPAQQFRFTNALARRIKRAAFDDRLQNEVLSPAATRLRKLSKTFDAASSPRAAPLAARLMRAITEWYVAGTDRRVEYKAVIDRRFLKDAGFFDPATREERVTEIEQAAQALKTELIQQLPAHGGYAVSLDVQDPESISLAEYVSWSAWIWESVPDLLEN